jgi:hypothetical protein
MFHNNGSAKKIVIGRAKTQRIPYAPMGDTGCGSEADVGTHPVKRRWWSGELKREMKHENGNDVDTATTREIDVARDRNNPISANQIRLQASLINQEHRPIRLHLLAGLSFRQ